VEDAGLLEVAGLVDVADCFTLGRAPEGYAEHQRLTQKK